MGRTRGFVLVEVLAAAQQAFVTHGYAGTSVDDLLGATGLHRSSLYQAFGSKRGLFDAVLEVRADAPAWSAADLDLLLVALLEVAPHDRPIRTRVAGLLARRLPDAAPTLGARLLERAGIARPDHEPPVHHDRSTS